MVPKKPQKPATRTLRQHTRLAQLQEKVLLEAAARPEVSSLRARLMSVATNNNWYGKLSKKQREALIYYVLGVYGGSVVLQQELGAVPQREAPLVMQLRPLVTAASEPVRRVVPAAPKAPIVPEPPASSAPPVASSAPPGSNVGSLLRALLREAALLDAAAASGADGAGGGS